MQAVMTFPGSPRLLLARGNSCKLLTALTNSFSGPRFLHPEKLQGVGVSGTESWEQARCPCRVSAALNKTHHERMALSDIPEEKPFLRLAFLATAGKSFECCVPTGT